MQRLFLSFAVVLLGCLVAAACLGAEDAGDYSRRAQDWLAKGEYEKALADFNQVLRLLDPDDTRNIAITHSNRGIVWDDMGEYDKAIADFNESLRLFDQRAKNAGLGSALTQLFGGPDDTKNIAMAYSNRGNAWNDKREYDKAIADCNEAIRLSPKYASAYSNRGNAWEKKGDYDKALADFSQALQLNPREASIYSNRSEAWRQKGEYDKAVADGSEAIRLNPKFAAAYFNRGAAWGDKGEYDKAIADSNEAIRLNPKLVGAYYNRGKAWRKKGEYGKAIADYNQVLAIDPKGILAYANLARLYATCPDEKYRDGKKAVEYASKACELTERPDWDNIDTLAAAYAESGDLEKAREWETKAIELAPDEKIKQDCRSRLELYKQEKPNGHAPNLAAPTNLKTPDAASRLELHKEGKPYREGPKMGSTTAGVVLAAFLAFVVAAGFVRSAARRRVRATDAGGRGTVLAIAIILVAANLLSLGNYFAMPDPAEVGRVVVSETARGANQDELHRLFQGEALQQVAEMDGNRARDGYAIGRMYQWVHVVVSSLISGMLVVLLYLRVGVARVLLGIWLVLLAIFALVGPGVFVTGDMIAFGVFPTLVRVLMVLDPTVQIVVGFGVGIMLFRSKTIAAYARKQDDAQGRKVQFDNPMRTWTDSMGKYTVEAEFVDFEGGAVRLKRIDGTEIDVPIEKLIEADREYVRAAMGK